MAGGVVPGVAPSTADASMRKQRQILKDITNEVFNIKTTDDRI